MFFMRNEEKKIHYTFIWRPGFWYLLHMCKPFLCMFAQVYSGAKGLILACALIYVLTLCLQAAEPLARLTLPLRMFIRAFTAQIGN